MLTATLPSLPPTVRARRLHSGRAQRGRATTTDACMHAPASWRSPRCRSSPPSLRERAGDSAEWPLSGDARSPRRCCCCCCCGGGGRCGLRAPPPHTSHQHTQHIPERRRWRCGQRGQVRTVGLAELAVQSVDRRDVHDPPVLLLPHDRPRRAAGRLRAVQVHLCARAQAGRTQPATEPRSQPSCWPRAGAAAPGGWWQPASRLAVAEAGFTLITRSHCSGVMR
jgi:hypothetical protein